VTSGADVPEDHREYAASILSRHAKAQGSMWDLGNPALLGQGPKSENIRPARWLSLEAMMRL